MLKHLAVAGALALASSAVAAPPDSIKFTHGRGGVRLTFSDPTGWYLKPALIPGSIIVGCLKDEYIKVHGRYFDYFSFCRAPGDFTVQVIF